MKIAVKRSGGFAGLTEAFTVDTGELGAARAQLLEQTVRGAGFFDLPAVIEAEAAGADLFRYEITVTEGDRRHSVTFVESDGPETESLRRLVEKLTD